MTRDLRREREIALLEQQAEPLVPRKVAERPAPPKRAQNQNAAFWLRQAEQDLIDTEASSGILPGPEHLEEFE